MKNLVLYHNHCTDGFMSATLMYLYFKEINELELTEFKAVNYNEPIPDITGKHVYIVDFSYSKDVLDSASLTAKSITMLDHHLSAAQQWGGYNSFKYKYNSGCDMFITIVEEKSGAGLTLDWIRKNIKDEVMHLSVFNNLDDDRISVITRSVQDRDLWKFNFDDTNEIHEALSILDKDFKDWEEFLVTSSYEVYRERLKAASYYLEVKEKLAQEYASKHQLINFLGFTVPIVNCPANFASRVCEIIYKDYPFAVSYSLNLNEIFVSFRSSKETGIDVSEIAKNFKGGGHKDSSGCKIPTKWIEFFLTGQLEFIKQQVNPEYYNVEQV